MQQKTEFTPEEHHRRGFALLEAGHGHEAFEHLSRAYLIDPQNARFRSSYALALALVRGQFLGAVELARAAVRPEVCSGESRRACSDARPGCSLARRALDKHPPTDNFGRHSTVEAGFSVGSVIKKRRKKMRKHKYKKLRAKQRHKRNKR